MEVVLQEEEERETQMENNEKSTSVMKWGRFLPRMSLRVLLVEADDSTRQIISALLRKCSYKVDAVRDGLKAWEVLQRGPNNIDLILTEVELPLISGFALLTLIMEHETCKNIPVIMMSSHDSTSMVFDYMLRGAADFLIKPIRKNELTNLWQHVWRRQSSGGGGQGRQDGSFAQRKVEAISENNAASNHSSDYVACTQKNKECSEKGSDAQSSCTKPDTEAESACMQSMQDVLQEKCSSYSPMIDRRIQKHEDCVSLDQESLMHKGLGVDKSIRLESELALWNEANDSARLIPGEDLAYGKIMTHYEDVAPENQREGANVSNETHEENYNLAKHSREAIELIGAFDNHPRFTYGHPYNTVIQEVLSNDMDKSGSYDNLGSGPLLELSLKRFHPSDSENQGSDERHTLNHSNASAFSWYNNRAVKPLLPTSTGVCIEPKEWSRGSHKLKPNQDPSNTANAQQNGANLVNNADENVASLVNGQSDQSETIQPCCQPGVIPVREIRFDGLCASYGTILPPMFYSQSHQLPSRGQNSGSQQETTIHLNSFHRSNPETHNSGQVCLSHDQNADNYTNQTMQEKEHNLESVENPGDDSLAAGQSANSSICNGDVSQHNSSGCGSVCSGSNGNVTPAAAAGATAESGNGEGRFVHDRIRGMDPHHSTQREAALTKFRLKRKERCYEKKVRYQSRKRLAEQRPRVKGQFVRQVTSDQLIC